VTIYYTLRLSGLWQSDQRTQCYIDMPVCPVLFWSRWWEYTPRCITDRDYAPYFILLSMIRARPDQIRALWSFYPSHHFCPRQLVLIHSPVLAHVCVTGPDSQTPIRAAIKTLWAQRHYVFTFRPGMCRVAALEDEDDDEVASLATKSCITGTNRSYSSKQPRKQISLA